MERRNPDSTRCSYFLASKQRYCRLQVSKSGLSEFCSEHQVKSEGTRHADAEHADAEHAAARAARIPCPYDGKHTVNPSLLEKHLKICPQRPKPPPVFESRQLNRPAGSKEQEDMARPPLSEIPLDQLKDVIARVQVAWEAEAQRLDLLTYEAQVLAHSALATQIDTEKQMVLI